jgi:glycosyltransferase involved in cell wall biosynthesis
MDLWNAGAGARLRSRTLFELLRSFAQIDIGIVGKLNRAELKNAECVLQTQIKPISPDATTAIAFAELRTIIQDCRPDIIFVDRLEQDFVLDAAQGDEVTVLDTQDIISDCHTRAAQYDVKLPCLTWEEEVRRFQRFDRVLFIQNEEFDRARAELGNDKCLLVPQPCDLRPTGSNQNRTPVIGTVASAWVANVDGMQWYLRHVEPRRKSPASVHIWGWLGQALATKVPLGSFFDRGFANDLSAAWSSIDVAINPVRFGSGLKIKSIEALCTGRPLVSTTEGVRGLPRHSDAFLVADSPAEFAESVDRLIRDDQLRDRMSENAAALGRELFSRERCFRSFFTWLDEVANSRGRRRPSLEQLTGDHL